MESAPILKKFSLLPQGIKYKLLVAFSLMSIIPLLVLGYFVNNFLLLEASVSLGQASIVVLFCIVIVWLGLFLAKSIVERVVDIALEARIITEGNFDRKISVDTGDEIGQIGEAINFLTRKIKTNMADLKDYQGKMKEINMDIQKRVSILSNLLQIGELISSSVKLDNILELITGKLSQIYENGFAALYYSSPAGSKQYILRASRNLEGKELLAGPVEEGRGLLGKALARRKHITVDASTRFSSSEQQFKTKYKCENIVAYPMVVSRNVRVLLVVGNDMKNFTYTSDDIEIVKVFAEQISIAIENDILLRKAEKLEIKDDLTGLFNKTYILNRLEEEIARSIVSQRPCSFVLVDIDNFKEYELRKGKPQAEIALRKIAALMTELSRPLGKPGVIIRDTFALILPEVNKKEAMELAEKARKKIEKLELSSDKSDRVTASGGVSENPLDGASVDEILEKATAALANAKQKGKNKIVSAPV